MAGQRNEAAFPTRLLPLHWESWVFLEEGVLFWCQATPEPMIAIISRWTRRLFQEIGFLANHQVRLLRATADRSVFKEYCGV